MVDGRKLWVAGRRFVADPGCDWKRHVAGHIVASFAFGQLTIGQETPLLSRGGVAARQRKSCEATLARADGVVLVTRTIFLDQHHPSRRYRVGFPLLG